MNCFIPYDISGRQDEGEQRHVVRHVFAAGRNLRIRADKEHFYSLAAASIAAVRTLFSSENSMRLVIYERLEDEPVMMNIGWPSDASVRCLLQNCEDAIADGREKKAKVEEAGMHVALCAPKYGMPQRMHADIVIAFSRIGLFFRLDVACNMNKYSHDTILCVCRLFIRFMKTAMHSLEMPLGDWAAHVCRTDKHKSIVRGARRGGRRRTLIGSVYTACRRYSQKVAISHGEVKWTYSFLYDKASCIAEYLIGAGIRKNDVIGILMEQSPELIAVMIGVLIAGGICMPLDMRYPQKLISDRLRMADAAAMISDRPGIEGGAAKVFVCHEILQSIASHQKVRGKGLPDDEIFMYFTSGSTDTPKAVRLTNHGIMNSITTKIHELGLGSRDKLSYALSTGFVASIWCNFAPILQGSELVLYDGDRSDVRAYFKHCIENGVTITEVMPAYLEAFLRTEEESANPLDIGRIRWIVITGDEIASRTVRTFYRQFGKSGPRLMNAYGQTESSDDVLHFSIYPDFAEQTVPLGRPALYTEVRIMDKNGVIVPQGVPGEIGVLGAGVVEGHSLVSTEGLRTYTVGRRVKSGYALHRTGDYGKIMRGIVYFMGRKAEINKINGFRLRLADVSDAALRMQSVFAACAMVRDESDMREIVLFCVVVDDKVSVSQIQEHLIQYLPWYMMPSNILLVDEIPLSENGKVDRQKLFSLNPELRSTADADPFDDLWQEFVGTDAVAFHQKAMIPGGYSLRIAALIAKISSLYDREFTVFDLLENRGEKTLKDMIRNNVHRLTETSISKTD